jgi:hypothetical protein
VLGRKLLIRTDKVDELVRVQIRTRARTIPCADNPRKAWREWKCHDCN